MGHAEHALTHSALYKNA